MQWLTYLIKPGTADPVHVVRCQTELTAKSAVSAVIFLPLGFIAQWQDYQDCLEQRHNEGYVDAPKEPECAYWRDDKPREPIKIRDRCKDNPPQWVLRGGNVTPHAAVAPTAPPRSSPSTVVGTWSGTLHGQQGSYPFTMTFRDDGTYQATSATLKPGSFEGTWQVSNGNVVWKSITTGRTGMATVQEANGKRTLRIIPDDGAYMLEMTPTTEVADVPTDFRKWLRGNWAGSGGGYELTISSDLSWQYRSTVRGEWYASGTARIEGPATVVLEGWFSGARHAGPAERLTMVLHRRGESLAGEFRLSRTWFLSFSRSSHPAEK